MKQRLQRLGFDTATWTQNLILLAIAFFIQRFGLGLIDGARTNFFVESLGLGSDQVLWLEGIREIPGLALIFLAALTMRLPLSYRTAASIILMGLGYGAYAFIGSYSALLVVAVIASLGMHMWLPLHSSLAMSLSPKGKTATVVGTLNGISALASIIGMGVLALIGGLVTQIPLSAYYLIGAGLVVVAGLLILRVPRDVGVTATTPPRMLVKRRYWLYYVLTFLQGSDKQVLNTFGLLVLVETFGLPVWQISLILVASSIVNLIGSPYMGRLIDRFGERAMISMSYVVLTVCCLGFAVSHNVWLLVVLLLAIKLFITVGIALETYVYRNAPAEELTPTLSAGVSINHVTSVGMPLVAGAVLPYVGYEGVFLGTAGLILLSIPFALALEAKSPLMAPVAATAQD
ncbi:MAG: MFS transporter [Anaerolineae bacterium]|nr:MFS transporter [Anaerolineae bacterium]